MKSNGGERVKRFRIRALEEEIGNVREVPNDYMTGMDGEGMKEETG